MILFNKVIKIYMKNLHKVPENVGSTKSDGSFLYMSNDLIMFMKINKYKLKYLLIRIFI